MNQNLVSESFENLIVAELEAQCVFENHLNPFEEFVSFEFPDSFLEPKDLDEIDCEQPEVSQPPPNESFEAQKAVGTLTKQQRRQKIVRFLEKRNHRNWGKRISYGCRKKVADNRVRVKGRFVSKEVATSISKERTN